MKTFIDDSRKWAKGRFPFFRLLLLIYLTYVGIHHIGNPVYSSWFGGLNLGIHELGHMVFSFFGKFIMVAGGSILQCLVPIISIFIFYRQRDFFAISISFGWLSTNLFYVATYIADSRSMSLPLVSPFGCEPLHDWNYILGKMGMLNYDTALASFIRLMAIVSMLICLVYGGWLVWLMLKSFNANFKTEKD